MWKKSKHTFYAQSVPLHLSGNGAVFELMLKCGKARQVTNANIMLSVKDAICVPDNLEKNTDTYPRYLILIIANSFTKCFVVQQCRGNPVLHFFWQQ
jgi:hypothetical protein